MKRDPSPLELLDYAEPPRRLFVRGSVAADERKKGNRRRENPVEESIVEAAVEYAPPQLVEVGDLDQLVLGGGNDDTADKGFYYY